MDLPIAHTNVSNTDEHLLDNIYNTDIFDVDDEESEEESRPVRAARAAV